MSKLCQGIKIIFIGTPEFGAIILEKLIKSGHKPFLVIAGQDKPVGRKQVLTPPPAKITAQNYNILVVQPEKILNHKSEILNLKPDLIILAAYGHLIPREILEIPKYGCLNVHPSLLPKHRGPSPIQSAILNGDEKTGVTIMRMTEKLDEGSILSQRELEIKSHKFQELHDKLAEMGAELLIETISKLLAGKINPQPQDDSKATFTKILTKDDGQINWQNKAEYIERQVRALNPEPGVYTYLNFQFPISNFQSNPKSQIPKLKLLKILEAGILSLQTDKKIGEVFLTREKELAVQCGQNCLILLKLQIEGGKPLNSQDFLLGHKEIVGTILC